MINEKSTSKPKNLYFICLRIDWQNSLPVRYIRKNHKDKQSELLELYLQMCSCVLRFVGDENEEILLIPVPKENGIDYDTLLLMLDSDLTPSELEQDIKIMSDRKNIAPLCEIIKGKGINVLLYDDFFKLDKVLITSAERQKRRKRQADREARETMKYPGLEEAYLKAGGKRRN